MATRLRRSTTSITAAGRVMDEAIALAIQGRTPYPRRASFVDSDAPDLAGCIAEAFDDDKAVVLVWPDGSSRVLQPGERIPAPASSAALKASGSGFDLPAA